MKPLRKWVFAGGAAALVVPLLAALAADLAAAQAPSPTEKLNAYVGCINRLSERSYDSRRRYFSWVRDKNGPTGRERIIYGLYTIYDTSDCRKNVEKANALEPRDAALEAAASGLRRGRDQARSRCSRRPTTTTPRRTTRTTRWPRARRCIRAWSRRGMRSPAPTRRCAAASKPSTTSARRSGSPRSSSSEGRSARYHVEALMIQAKRVLRAQDAAKPDIAAITQALGEYEATVKSAEQLAGSGDGKIGSIFIGSAKSFLTSAKQLMRRIRDKVPYSQGDRMMINAGGGEMIEGTPQRLMRDYNRLIEAYNSGARI